MQSNLKRFAALLLVAGILTSCAGSLSLYDRKNMPHWREADKLVGKELRWSDVWVEIAYKDREPFTIQKSEDYDWELSDSCFTRDTVIVRELWIDGVKVYPTTIYKTVK